MIIGIDASRANNLQKTGVECYAFQLIQELKKNIPENVRVVLYTDKPLQGQLSEMPVNWQEKVLHWPPKRLWTQIRLSWEMFVNPPDVLFIPAHVFPIVHPKKTIMTVHDVAAAKYPKSFNWFERWYSLWSAKHALNTLWKIITPSGFTKKELERLETGDRRPDDKIFIIKHGYDKKYKVIDDEKKIVEILKKYKVKKPFVMSVGRLEEKKNTVNIVKAFEIIKQKNNLQSSATSLQLLLVGSPGFGYEKVAQVIRTSQYKDDIIQPGWVSEQDLPYLMNAAELFVFPSLYEGFGLPVLEAMACGTPVVTADESSLNEVAGKAALYVDPSNIDAIATTIQRFLDDNNLREEKVVLGLERVKKFSWQKCASDTLGVIVKKEKIC
ncbi:MAG: glycosyltransferase [Candidatus Magasanikbacteria bacterium]|nr:glycosyltransferase [Candidatus Magasanikbacteria bacterium]